MTQDYSYKVTMTSEGCGAKRAVAFHDAAFLTWSEIRSEAYKHMFSQNCARCNEAHANEDYVMTDAERGEPSMFGFYSYRDVYPSYKKTNQMELPV